MESIAEVLERERRAKEQGGLQGKQGGLQGKQGDVQGDVQGEARTADLASHLAIEVARSQQDIARSEQEDEQLADTLLSNAARYLQASAHLADARARFQQGGVQDEQDEQGEVQVAPCRACAGTGTILKKSSHQSRGGVARAATLTPERRKEIATKASQAAARVRQSKVGFQHD